MSKYSLALTRSMKNNVDWDPSILDGEFAVFGNEIF